MLTSKNAPRKTLALFLSFCLCLAALPPQAASAQDPGQQGTFFETVDVDVVNVEVFVTDKQGNSITGLTQEDFVVQVDKREVPITNFYSEVLGRPAADGGAATTPLPETPATPSALTPLDQRLHLIIFVDNAHIRPPNRKRVFNALREFLDSTLGPEDLVSVVSLNRSSFVHNDFVNDRRLLDQILDEVQETAAESLVSEVERRRVFSELFRSGTASTRDDDVSALFNSREILSRIRAFAQEQYEETRHTLDTMAGFVDTLAGIPGRKAMLHVSDGIPTNPGEDMFAAYIEKFANLETDDNAASDIENDYEAAIGRYDLFQHFRELSRHANASRVTVYALDAEASHSARVRSAAVEGFIPSNVLSIVETNYRQPMEMLAVATGGQRIQSSPRLAENLASITTDFNTFYSLGFQAPQQPQDKPYEIEVKVKDRKDLIVRHRDSFRPKGADQRMGEATLATLLFNSGTNPLAFSLEPLDLQKQENGNALLPLRVKIPVGNIVLLPQGDFHKAQLSIFVSVKGKGGDTRPVQKLPFHLNIPADKVEEARQHEAEYVLPLLMEAGDQQVAVGVRDDVAATESTLRMELPSLRGG